MTPSKVPIYTQKTETEEKLTPKNKSSEIFGMTDSAQSNKEEIKFEFDKRFENVHRDLENLRADEYTQRNF